MNANELLDVIGCAEDRYVMEAQRHRTAMQPVRRKRYPVKRALLIAAIVALLVALVGFAAIVLNLDSLKLGQFSFDTVDGESRTMDLISLQGFTGSSNYLAAQEWQKFLAEYDPDGELLKQSDDDLYFPPQAYESYLCYTEEMVQKVDELCERYGLELLGPVQVCNNPWTVLDEVGVQSIFDPNYAGIREGDGYYYWDGTFQISGSMELCGTDVAWVYPVEFQYRSVKKTSFDSVFINVWSTEQYEQWSYTTQSGAEVLLALAPEHGLIIADKRDAFVTMSIQNVSVGDVLLGEQHMDKAVMEALADVLVLDYATQAVQETPVQSTEPAGAVLDEQGTKERLFEQVFLSIVQGTVGRDWNAVCSYIAEQGYTVTAEEGCYSVDDPEDPNHAVYGDLTTEHGTFEIASVVYYWERENTVRAAKVQFGDVTSYYVDVVFPAEGIPVGSLDEVIEYLLGDT